MSFIIHLFKVMIRNCGNQHYVKSVVENQRLFKIISIIIITLNTEILLFKRSVNLWIHSQFVLL